MAAPLTREQAEAIVRSMPAYGDCEICHAPVYPRDNNIRSGLTTERVWHTKCWNDLYAKD